MFKNFYRQWKKLSFNKRKIAKYKKFIVLGGKTTEAASEAIASRKRPF
jgi:hypothetical protein